MDLKSLKKNRSSLKAKLTIFNSFLQPLLLSKELNSLQSCELSTRLNKIQEMYNDFDTAQTEIENLSEITGDEFKEREAFETSFFGTVAAAQELLGKNQAASAAHDDQVTGSSGVSAHSEHWDILIIHMVLGKLDQTSIREWEIQRNSLKDLPSLEDFNLFLKNRADLLETMEDANNKPRRHSDITHGHDEQRCKLGPCRLCSQKHNSMLHIHNSTNTVHNDSKSSECVVLPALQTKALAESQPIKNNITLSSIHESQ
ncbi:Gag-pol polyprotein, partial [Operophtera brumata]